MSEYTTFQISSQIYWGFQHNVTNNRFKTITVEEILLEIKNHMKKFFETYNLIYLKEGVDKLDLHIHQPLIPGEIIYVCDHKHD